MTDKKLNAAEQIRRLMAESGKAPAWLHDALTCIADHADRVRPLPEQQANLPEFIYRH